MGLYLEERTRKRAWGDVEEHVKKLYSRAMVVPDDNVVEVDADKVPLGGIVEVKSGEITPVDGVVVERSSAKKLEGNFAKTYSGPSCTTLYYSQ